MWTVLILSLLGQVEPCESVITAAPFFECCDGNCNPEGEYREGDCDGDGIYNGFDNDNGCEGDLGGPPGPCGVDPCAEGCGAYGTEACSGEFEGGDPGNNGGEGDGVPYGNQDCDDYDDDGVCDECDVDKPGDDDEEPCEDEDEDGVCDECQFNCWTRLVERFRVIWVISGFAQHCEPIYLRVESLTDYGIPPIYYNFDTCFSSITFINDTRPLIRSILVWALSIYAVLYWVQWFLRL